MAHDPQTNETIQHAQVSTTTEQPDGSFHIETESYYDKLARREQEIKKSTVVPFQGLLKEMIDCTEKLMSGSGRVQLEIVPTPAGYYKVTKRWLVDKQVFDRK